MLCNTPPTDEIAQFAGQMSVCRAMIILKSSTEYELQSMF